MIRKIGYFSMHLILIFCSVEAFATVYDYKVIGHFEVDDINQYVSGNMQISDEFLFWDNGAFDPVYGFDITSFSLNVFGGGSSYGFSGDQGLLAWIHQITDPLTGQKSYEEQWVLSNSVTGDFWIQPYSTCMDFFTAEMIPYKPTSTEYYGVLAPIIALWGPCGASQHDPCFSMGGGPIWLTRNSAPVPESSTLVLLSTGILIPFFARRRKNKSTSCF